MNVVVLPCSGRTPSAGYRMMPCPSGAMISTVGEGSGLLACWIGEFYGCLAFPKYMMEGLSDLDAFMSPRVGLVSSPHRLQEATVSQTTGKFDWVSKPVVAGYRTCEGSGRVSMYLRRWGRMWPSLRRNTGLNKVSRGNIQPHTSVLVEFHQ